MDGMKNVFLLLFFLVAGTSASAQMNGKIPGQWQCVEDSSWILEFSPDGRLISSSPDFISVMEYEVGQNGDEHFIQARSFTGQKYMLFIHDINEEVVDGCRRTYLYISTNLDPRPVLFIKTKN